MFTHVIRHTVQSKFVIFAVLDRRLIHGVITGSSFFLFNVEWWLNEPCTQVGHHYKEHNYRLYLVSRL